MKPRTCQHVHATGALCGSPAVGGRDYCHWHMSHLGRRMRAARSRSRHQPPALVLPALDDPIAVHVALMQVLDAIASNDIEVHRGRALLTGLRFASTSLKKVGEWKQEQEQDPKPLFVPGENSDTEWPSFEQEHDLPPNFDLTIAPEVAFPPQPEPEKSSGAPYIPAVGMYGNDALPLNPTAGLSGAPTDGNDALRARMRQVLDEAATPITENLTADDMELMEVCRRDGERAMIQRQVEQQRARRRRERREERAHYEALARDHNLQMAAKQLLREQGWREQAEAEEAKRLADLARVGCEDPLKEHWSVNRRKRPESQAAGATPESAQAAAGA
jgi:hypothetical protein